MISLYSRKGNKSELISFIITENEKSRYFLLYETIRAIVLIGRGMNVPLKLQVKDIQPGMSNKDMIISDNVRSGKMGENDVDTIDENLAELDLQNLEVWFESERIIGEPIVGPKGPVEFVFLDGPLKTSKICFIVKV